MSEIMIIPRIAEINGYGNGNPIRKIYTIGDIEVIGEVSSYSVAPLRILGHVLKEKGINFQVTTNGNDPWHILQMKIDEKDIDFAKIALEEIMAYRCAVELGERSKEIIRELPFAVAMKTSDNIMRYGEPLSGGTLNRGDLKYISKSEPEKRKHLIYESARGGYNIKTKGYFDENLIHYGYSNSEIWD